jgi:uncharacterized cupin superfamily protein
MDFMVVRLGDFAPGVGVNAVASNAADGNAIAVPAGFFVLTIEEEPVEIVRGAATVTQGNGTPLGRGTQWLIRVDATEQWAIRSKGGTGRVVLTRVEID